MLTRTLIDKFFAETGISRARPLPAHGSSIRVIITKNGEAVMAWIMPKAEAAERGIVQRTRGQCPRCFREFALGNLPQHMNGRIGRGRTHVCTGA